jgi:hypothetical protein
MRCVAGTWCRLITPITGAQALAPRSANKARVLDSGASLLRGEILLHKVIVAGVVLFVLNGCGGDTPTAPPQVTPVTMNITFVDSYTGQPAGTKTIAANAGWPVSISLADASGTDLDKNFGALREAGMPIGPRVAATTTGTITTTAKQGNYELFVHSSLASDMYPCGINGMSFGRNATVRKLNPGEAFPRPGVTIVEGPADGDQIMQDGLAMITDALTAGGRQYGSLTWSRNSSSATMAGGFASGDIGGAGYNEGNQFVVRYAQGIVRVTLVDVVIEEAGEPYFALNDACGMKMLRVTCPGPMGTCAMRGTISEKGKAWFRANATQAP